MPFQKPLVWYGRFDVLEKTEEYINPCICGAKPLLKGTRSGNSVRWQVVCPKCGRTAEGSKKKWQAVINWNKAPVSKMPHWKRLPIFGLWRFRTVEEAGEYLKEVRTVLENRLKEAKSRLKEGIPVGRKYEERLRAFLAWTIYAQGVAKYWKNKDMDSYRHKHSIRE